MADEVQLILGGRFTVKATTDFVVDNEIVARYQPQFTYRVTSLNKDFVTALVEGGNATYLGGGNGKEPKPASVVKTGS